MIRGQQRRRPRRHQNDGGGGGLVWTKRGSTNDNGDRQ
jgi:hypothetical protein